MSFGRRLWGALLSGIVTACTGAGPAPEHRPNVVLVTVDTLRADHLDAHGYERPTAPVFTELMQDGVLFTHAISQAPWTLPAMASVHSSLYPRQHGAVAAGTAMPEAADTLAEHLSAAGYTTVGVISHQFVNRAHGFAQGFDVFDESQQRGHEEVTSRDLTETALAVLATTEAPFFLWVHYFDPHFTYVRHPEVGFADGYDGPLPDQLTADRLNAERPTIGVADLDYVEAVYDEEIRHTDRWIGALWDGVRARHGDQGVLILTADHGEYFLERGRFFHGRDVYRELVHVPLLIAGAVPADLRGATVAQPVETRFIARTVAGLLGEPDWPFAGTDLLGIARGEPAPPVFTEGSFARGATERKVAVTDQGWKLIVHLDDGRRELYDLTSDPWERVDYWGRSVGDAGSVAPALQSLLDDFRRLPALRPQPVGLTPDDLDRLRSLGYVR